MLEKNIMLDVRFQIPSVESDDELKARFLCRYPKAKTREKSGSWPFDTYAVCRVFRVETNDVQDLLAFCQELNQDPEATFSVGSWSDSQDWWDGRGRRPVSKAQKTLDRLNELSSLIFDREAVPLDHLRWFMLAWVCKWLEPDEGQGTLKQSFSYYLDMSEKELRINAYHWMADHFFKKAAIQLPNPRAGGRKNFRDEFEIDYKRFVVNGQEEAPGSFVENSALFNCWFWFGHGPAAVADRMSSLQAKIEELGKVLAAPDGIGNYNQEIEKESRLLDDKKQPATRGQLEALRDTCVTYQQEIQTHLPVHWINWVVEKKAPDAVTVKFWARTDTAARHLLETFATQYPDAKIRRQVGYSRGVKNFVLAFQLLDYQTEWHPLRQFSIGFLADDNISGGHIWPDHSGDWENSCDGIADFSADNMVWEIAKLAYDPHAAPTEGLRAALIYDAICEYGWDKSKLKEGEGQHEAIVRLGLASEAYLRDAGYHMLNTYGRWLIDDYGKKGEEPVVNDHERFVLNGHQEESGVFLRDSAVLDESGVTLWRAMRHMKIAEPYVSPEEQKEMDDLLQSLFVDDLEELDEPDSHDGANDKITAVISPEGSADS